MTDRIPDDPWILMMASYWRITSAIERKVREETEGMPEWLATETANEIREIAYPEERRIWSAGMDRLMEIYGVTEGPEPQPQQPLSQGALLDDDAMSRCKSCGAAIRWEVTAKGKPMPISVATGETHFGDCPQSKSWSRKKVLA